MISFAEHGAGPPLVLIHGAMISGDMFAPVVDALVRRHRLIVPDLRGHGRSRHLPPPYTPAQQAADLAALLDRLGIERVAVLGYSQGGAVAQQFVVDYPARCGRLVLACTYAFNAATLREKIEARVVPLFIRALGMPRFARFVIAIGLRQVARDRAEWVTKLIADQDPKTMIAAWKAAMAFDGRPRLGEIQCPTLVVAGARDNAVPVHHANMLLEGISGSQLAVIEDGDHALIWSHPDEFVRVTEQFLQVTPTAGG